MPRTDEDLLREAYAAFNSRDINAGLALMDAEVDWPNVAEGGYVHGHDEVGEHWREQFGQVDPRIEAGPVTTRTDGRAEVRVRQVIRDLDGNRISDDHLIHVFTIRDGLITRMEVEPTDPAKSTG
jgi:ketosteroid isomerase-like protein